MSEPPCSGCERPGCPDCDVRQKIDWLDPQFELALDVMNWFFVSDDWARALWHGNDKQWRELLLEMNVDGLP